MMQGINRNSLCLILVKDHVAPMQAEEPVWEALLRFAVQEQVDAVIDCGALLAGTKYRWACQHAVVMLGVPPSLRLPLLSI
jgi:hypothetical protein